MDLLIIEAQDYIALIDLIRSIRSHCRSAAPPLHTSKANSPARILGKSWKGKAQTETIEKANRSIGEVVGPGKQCKRVANCRSDPRNHTYAKGPVRLLARIILNSSLVSFLLLHLLLHRLDMPSSLCLENPCPLVLVVKSIASSLCLGYRSSLVVALDIHIL